MSKIGAVMGTKLDRYLSKHRITTSQLARVAGLSRKHVSNVRNGKAEPGHDCISAVLSACRELTREPLRVDDIFDFTRRKVS